MATAGVLSEEESVGAPQYSPEEMKAAVDEAAMWGRKVAAHAHGTEGIKRAIRAGVASVEHCSFIDDEGIALAKEHGTWLVFDIYNDDYILAEFGRMGYPEKILEKERLVGRTQRENFQKAVKAGAKIAYGTDSGVYPHGWNGKQFFHMVKWGMTPMQAIQCRHGARRRPPRLEGQGRPACPRLLRRPHRRARRPAGGCHRARAGRLRHEGRHRREKLAEHRAGRPDGVRFECRVAACGDLAR